VEFELPASGGSLGGPSAGTSGGALPALDQEGLLMLQAMQKAMVGDFTLISNNKFNTPSGTCHELQYTGRFGDNPMQWKQRFWIKGKMVYVLTLTALPDEFKLVSKSGTTVMDSFWIK
jgi:hypothetical protein